MADHDLSCTDASTRFGDVVEEVEDVYLRRLPPLTTVLVRTMNSMYRVVITHGPEVCVQGGTFFPDPTPAYLEGASIGGSSVKVGWIGVGLLMEIRLGDRRIVTSQIRAITTIRSTGSAVHQLLE